MIPLPAGRPTVFTCQRATPGCGRGAYAPDSDRIPRLGARQVIWDDKFRKCSKVPSRFVLTRLEKEGLKPAGDADKQRLIRRVALDLMRAEGLTGEQIKRSPSARSFGIRDGHGLFALWPIAVAAITAALKR